ncbi:MAG TPA: mechanosensitive ion channel domain-containing protein [Candidatus Solibacter sp.]|nr:mechanosensitive ion channel domain-containing protein [Candidatus Solibacter sp.]
MKITRTGGVLAGIFALALAACVIGAYLTGEPTVERRAQTTQIDRRLLDTARQVAPVAETAAEQEFARTAQRLADHELDQAFASAVREAATTKPAANPAVQKFNARITEIRQRIAQDQQRIAKLEKAGSEDQAEVVKAQLALDDDELEDAQQDLIRHGGDERTRLERARQEHADAQKSPATPAQGARPIEGATLASQIAVWADLNSRYSQIQSARQQAAAKQSALEREHNSLEMILAQKPTPTAASDDSSADEQEDTAGMLARLHQLSDQRKTLTELDRRIQDCQQLAQTYGNWASLIAVHRTGVLHRLLRSLALVFGLLFVVALADGGLRHAFAHAQDRRRGHQQRFLVRLTLRVAAAAAVLMIVFGPPSQTPTIIGLAGAGLTVVLKDFIVAFFGWFVLIGRNGIRVGDWVEIKGVGGEVIEVGLFKTVLLEMGNWTNTGHPTGRRVSFMNGYAIEGHFFNFSTAGQWLWDELQVAIPTGADAYAIAQRIREVVERETEADAQLAEQDWERITKQYGTQAFSAKPAIDLRPGLTGLEVQVRYITRGPQRYEVKSRLFREIVGLMR